MTDLNFGVRFTADSGGLRAEIERGGRWARTVGR